MKIRKISLGVIIDGKNILLIKRRYNPHKNTWCPPGGFTNKLTNESVKDCVIREVKEETNIDVEIIKKIKILDIGYNKEKDRNEEIHLFLCKSKSNNIIINNEVLDAKWFDLDNLDSLHLTPKVDEVINSLRLNPIIQKNKIF